MIRTLMILFRNDIASAWKNKSILLIAFIPLFAVLTLALTDPVGPPLAKIKLGLINDIAYPPVILKSIEAAESVFSIAWISAEQVQPQLKGRALDGILIAAKKADSVELLVLRKESIQTVSIVENITSLQRLARTVKENWITAVNPLLAGAGKNQTLPTWLMMVVLLVSFVILPAQVAEEKEKKLLMGLLQTPMRETEWLAAKIIAGMVLTHGAILLLFIPGGFIPAHAAGVAAFLEAGIICYGSCGILLGLLCRTQASARVLGVLLYIPLMIPAALADYSSSLHALAGALPSSLLYGPLKSMLLENGSGGEFLPQGALLYSVGTVAFLFSRFLIKKRWLM